MTDAEKLTAIRRLAQRHNTPAVNVGCHRLAGLILKIINHTEGRDHDET